MKIVLKPIEAQVAVIVGASSGIGRLTALEMAAKGAKICAAARSVEGLESLVREIEEAGGEAFYVAADVSDFEQVKTVADKCVERYGRIDTWIHTAGVFLFGTVEKTTPDEYKRLIEVNLLGQIYGAKAALPYLKIHGGSLIHVNSVEALRAAPYQSAYGASKHGVHGFVQVLRAEIAHEKLPVSLTEIMPAPINTPIYEKGRNKMDFKMRPIPPVYHPRVVTDAILYAAENPVRELVAGGSGLGVIYSERISPQVADIFWKTIGFDGQNGGEKNTPEQFVDNLFEPVSGYDKVEGNFSDEQLMSDPYTFIKTSPRAKNALLLGVIGTLGGFAAWKIFGKKEHPLSKTKFKNEKEFYMKTEELLKKVEENRNENSCSFAEKDFSSETESARVFGELKTKLSDISEWNKHSGLSSYTLFDADGSLHDSNKLSVGVFNRIALTASGKYDWVQIINITDDADEFIITVKPTYDPTAEKVDKTVISHFFTDEATNNFCVVKKGVFVKMYVIGIAEKQNTSETGGVIESARNVAVNLGTYLGVQKGEWEKFCNNFLEDAAK